MPSIWTSLPLADIDVFGQSLGWGDLGVIGMLVVLEGVLSIDNALVLGLLAKRLPKHQQQRALTYGLVGAFVFRAVAVLTASYLMRWRIVKLLGGGYLLYVAVKHLFFERYEDPGGDVHVGAQGEPELVDVETGLPLSPAQEQIELKERVPVPLPSEVVEPATRRTYAKFWPTVIVIELTDIAFAVDSILAAIALSNKLWVVITGGLLGVVLMRFAAVVFIRLLEKFPRFETAAYLLIIVIGGKLLADWGFNSAEHPHRLDFHSWQNPAFWVFWILMLGCFSVGFLPRKDRSAAKG